MRGKGIDADDDENEDDGREDELSGGEVESIRIMVVRRSVVSEAVVDCALGHLASLQGGRALGKERERVIPASGPLGFLFPSLSELSERGFVSPLRGLFLLPRKEIVSIRESGGESLLTRKDLASVRFDEKTSWLPPSMSISVFSNSSSFSGCMHREGTDGLSRAGSFWAP